MNEKLIEELAKAEFEASMNLEIHSMQNVSMDYETRKKQAIEYAKAKARWAEAERALRKEIGK